MTYTHPLAKEAEDWWLAHGQRDTDPEWHRLLGEYLLVLGEKFDELRRPHINEGEDGGKRFGMAGAGSCTRKAGLSLLGFPGEPPSGSTKWTWFMGHLLEPMAISMLRVMGYAVEGSQEPARIDPFMASFSDGIMPAFDSRPTVLSVKTSGYKMGGFRNGKPERRGFAALPLGGVHGEQPSWWVQAQAEMHALQMDQALIFVIAKDTVKAFEGDPYMDSLAFYAEVIAYDEGFVQGQLLPAWQLAWAASQAGDPPRPFVYNPTSRSFAELPRPGDTTRPPAKDKHPNTEAAGLGFNSCGYCSHVEPCRQALASAYRRAS